MRIGTMAQVLQIIRQPFQTTRAIRCLLCISSRNYCDSSGISSQDDKLLDSQELNNNLNLNNKSQIEQSFEGFIKKELNNTVTGTDISAEFPSDIKNIPKKINSVRAASNFDDGEDEAESTKHSVVLFPGQGSQFVGMGKHLLKYPGVSDLYSKASEYLGYDLLSLCLNGPREKLNMTQYCQPAIMVTSLACLEKLKEEYPSAIETCVATAGYSVGEYTSLVFSGCLSFEDGLALLAKRAKAMQEASETVSSGMLSVYVNRETKIRTAMVAAKEYCRVKLHMEEPVCKIANYACTNIVVIAGHEEAIDFIQHFGREWGILRSKRIPVSGAFHTELMKLGNTYPDFINVLDNVKYTNPKIPVYMNATGSRVPQSLRKIPILLRQQMYKPVLWEQTMHGIFQRPPHIPFPTTYGIGPGDSLKVFLKHCNGKAVAKYISVGATS